MRKRIFYTTLILIITFLTVLLINNQTIEKFQDTRGYDIIVIAGQSNSIGRGLEEHRFPKTSSGMNHKTWSQTINMYVDDYFGTNGKRNSLISSLKKDNSIQKSAIDPIEHQEPYPYRFRERNITRNFGFGVSFAREYIRQGKLASGRKILLVGCGYGNTGFRNNGGWMSPNGGLYLGTIARANRAFTKTDEGSSNRFIAILWHQGEFDISSPNNYKENISNTLNGIRNAIQKPNSQSIPILMGGLMNTGTSRMNFTEQNIKSVKDMTGNTNFYFVPSSAMPNVYYKDLRLFNHDLLADKDTGENHFSKSSLIEFGKRYFYIFNKSKFDIQN